MTEHPGSARVRDEAQRLGLEIELVERGPAGSLEEAAAALGLTPRDVVKTLVVKHKDGAFLFALVPGDRQISWPKLRAVVGVNKLSLPDATTALAATGYERGTITPLGSSTAWPVYADASILADTPRRVALGAGAHGVSMLADATQLLEALGATVAEIGDPLP